MEFIGTRTPCLGGILVENLLTAIERPCKRLLLFIQDLLDPLVLLLEFRENITLSISPDQREGGDIGAHTPFVLQRWVAEKRRKTQLVH